MPHARSSMQVEESNLSCASWCWYLPCAVLACSHGVGTEDGAMHGPASARSPQGLEGHAMARSPGDGRENCFVPNFFAEALPGWFLVFSSCTGICVCEARSSITGADGFFHQLPTSSILGFRYVECHVPIRMQGDEAKPTPCRGDS